jgi:hypothetical protein
MAHPLKAILNAKIPAFAEAPALRKASGGGASRRQMPNEYQMPKCQMTLTLILSFGFHLNFVI